MSGPAPRRRRGQPLVALAMVLSAWVGARAVILEGERAPAGQAGQSLAALAARPAAGALRSASTPGKGLPASVPLLAAQGQTRAAPSTQWAATQAQTSLVRPPEPVSASLMPQQPAPIQPPPQAAPAPLAPPPLLSGRIAGGHQLLYLAGLSQLALPQLASLADADAAKRARQERAADRPRWSGDAWLLWRRGGNGFNLPGAGLPWVHLPTGAYGASQAGAVIRFRLAPASPLRPALYLRATTGLQTPRGEEVAGGLSLRPLSKVPVAAMAELRATRTLTGTLTRPAIALVSELPPADLPFGLKAETYLAAGYVGGSGSTLFADGQARVERQLAKAGPFALSAGLGAWGGIQRGAKRLDVGPSAELAVPIGPVGSRLSADWRFRVAGNAAPTSGPALTLSAGF